jgi:hypothetical protein
MNIDYAGGIKFLETYSSHFDEFLDFELQKLRLMNERKIEELSVSLATEQAFIMKTNNLELRRIKFFGNLTFEKLTEAAPDVLKERLRRICEHTRETILHIRDVNDLMAVNANEHLKRIHRRTKEFEVYNDRGGVRTDYRKNNADFKV